MDHCPPNPASSLASSVHARARRPGPGRRPPGTRWSTLAVLLAWILAGLTLTAMARVSQGADLDVRIPVMVRLLDPPAVPVFVATRARLGERAAVQATRAQIRRIQAAQDRLLSRLTPGRTILLFRTQRVYNGVALLVPQEDLPLLAGLPEVDRVQPLPSYRPARVRGVPWVGSPRLWTALGDLGVTGRNVTIGIVDTGIDYLHTDFGGPGTGYTDNDPTVITDVVGGISFPTAKVIGGYDFAGDEYNGLDRPIPQPDPDPMDCWGHGTHVAGIAAGYGIRSDGSTYPGPYTGEIPWEEMALGPGVAPEASLVALKIFGCQGVSHLLNLALEWAVDPNGDGDLSDRLDVVNLSIGSSFGHPQDPGAEAADNAARAGVVVVAAAGNSGDTYYAVMSPGSADLAISVGATSLEGLPFPGQEDLSPSVSNVDLVVGFSARGPRRGDAALKPDILAPGHPIVSARGGSGDGTAIQAGTSMATPFVSGAMALLRQLHPSWRVEELKALVMNSALPQAPASHTFPLRYYGPARVGAGRLDVAQAARTDVLLYAADVPGQVSLSFGRLEALGWTRATRTLRLANRGPLTRTYLIEYMPTVDMPSARVELTPTGPITLPPYAATSLAVTLEVDGDTLRRNPDPTVRPLLTFPRHRLSEESGSLVAWPRPARFQATLDGRNQVPPVASELSGTLALDLEPRTGQAWVTGTLSSRTPVTVTAVHLHLGHATVNGPTVLTLTTGLLPPTRSLTFTGQIALDRTLRRDLASGFLYADVHTESWPQGAARDQLRPQDPLLRLPLYAAPRPVSAMGTEETVLDLGTRPTGTFTVTLVGRGLLTAPSLDQAEFPTDTVSLVSLLELQVRSPNEATSPPRLDHADLKYVGIATDRHTSRVREAPDPVAASRLLFGLATYGEWSTPNQLTFRIELDTDEDGQVDYRLENGDYGSFRHLPPTDEFLAVLEDRRSPGARDLTYFLNLVSAQEMETRLFDSNVLLMAVDARAVGLDRDNPDLNYRVVTFSQDSLEEDTPVDQTGWLHYDLERPGLWAANPALSDFPIFPDLPQTTIQVTVDRAGMQHNGSQGLLLLHHFNEAEVRAQIIGVQARWSVYLPRITHP